MRLFMTNLRRWFIKLFFSLERGDPFRELIEAVQESVFNINREGIIEYVNGFGANVLGRNKEDILGQSISTLFPPEIAVQHRLFIQKVFETGESVCVENESRIPDGKVWFQSNFIPIKNSQGEIISVAGFVRDITDARQAIEERLLSEIRFKGLFENSPISLWEEDFSLVFVYIDELRQSGVKNFRAYFEDHPEVVVNCVRMVKVIDVNEKTLLMYHAKTKDDFLENLERIFCEDSLTVFKEELICIAEGMTRFEFESVNQTLSGDRMNVMLKFNIAPSTGETQYRAFLAVRDITTSKQTEQEMAQNQIKLTVIANELELRNGEMVNLAEMGDLLQACQTSEETYTVVAKYGLRLFPSASGTLSIFNNSRNLLNVVACWGQSETTAESFDPQSCWALRLGKLHIHEGDNGVHCTHFLLQTAAAASICVPLIAQSDILGVISLAYEPPSSERVEAASHFPETKLHLVTAFAEQIGIAIANMKLREMLRYQAIRDPLTNLYNRRFMVESLERELSGSKRKEFILGIIMLDIDHFKKFNDSFGHEAGDHILKTLGKYFLSHMRAGDIACRFGGEEFIIIFPETSLSIIYNRAEELREGVKQMAVLYKGKSLGNITVSLGISLFPEHGETADLLLQAADKALYLAKAGGRDRVMVADMTVNAFSSFESQLTITPDPAELSS